MIARLGLVALTIGWLGLQLATGPEKLMAQQVEPLSGLGSAEEVAPYQLSALLVASPDSAQAHLIVKVELPADSYLYSLTQPGELATRVEVALGEDGKIAGVMRPVTLPKVNPRDEFAGGRSEKHYGTIHFILPVQRLTARPLDQWEVAVRLNGQVCSEQGSCQLIRDEIVSARFTPLDEQAGALLRQAEASHRPLNR
jgi:hypothetical protein